MSAWSYPIVCVWYGRGFDQPFRFTIAQTIDDRFLAFYSSPTHPPAMVAVGLKSYRLAIKRIRQYAGERAPYVLHDPKVLEITC